MAPRGGGLVLGPGCWEVETALRSSFIRQMSPSQAMNNRRAPSVRRYPPGLVGSLLPSVPCHGLAPTACLHQHLSFPFFPPFPFPGHGTQMLCLCPTPSVCSVCLFLFSSQVFLYHPHLLSSFSSPSKSPKSNPQADCGGEKKKKKGYKSKRVRCPPGILGGMRAEVIYLPLVWSLMECLPSSCCGVSPSFPSLHSSVPIFISLTVAFSSWVQRPGKRAHVSKRKVIPSWKRRMTV